MTGHTAARGPIFPRTSENFRKPQRSIKIDAPNRNSLVNKSCIFWPKGLFSILLFQRPSDPQKSFRAFCGPDLNKNPSGRFTAIVWEKPVINPPQSEFIYFSNPPEMGPLGPYFFFVGHLPAGINLNKNRRANKNNWRAFPAPRQEIGGLLEPQDYRQNFGDSPLAQGRPKNLRASPAPGRAGEGGVGIYQKILPRGVWRKPALIAPVFLRIFLARRPLALFGLPLTWCYASQLSGSGASRCLRLSTGCGDRKPDHTLAL